MTDKPIKVRFSGQVVKLSNLVGRPNVILDDRPLPKSVTPEQREVVEDLMKSGFDIIVYADGAVELRR